MRRLVVFLASVVPATQACRGVSAAGWDGAIRDSAGIEIVENFGAPLRGDGTGWQFTEALRIGTADGDPEYEFGRIGGMIVLSDRRVVVADQMAQHLRFFSATGVHERTVGRKGQGPGEFGGGGLHLRLGRGDTVLAWDRGNRQIHVIAPDGAWLESFSVRPRDGYQLGMFLDAGASGRLLTYVYPVRQPDGTLTDSTDLLLEIDVHGAVVDTVARLPTWLVSLPPGQSMPFYSEAVSVAPCQEGVVIGHNYQFRMASYGTGGVLRRVVSLPRERLPLTEEDRSVMLGRYDQLLRANNVAPARAAAVKANVQFTERYPHYTWLGCGPAGTLLVQRVRPLRDLNTGERSRIRTDLQRPPGSGEWDVFDPGGRYVGAVALPGSAWVDVVPSTRFVQDRVSGGWYMYSVWSDEQDVQYVIGWRLDGPMPH